MAVFKFKGADNKTHSLPSAVVARKNLPGRALRDAALGGEEAQLTYLFRLVEACGAKPTALDALYDLPQDDMLDVLRAWGKHVDTDEGASLGESSGSSN